MSAEMPANLSDPSVVFTHYQYGLLVPRSSVMRFKDAGHIPGPANVPGVIEIILSGSLPNAKRYHFGFNGYTATPPSNLASLASALWTALSSAWSTNLASLMANTTTIDQVRVRDMTSSLNPVSIGTGTAIPGTSAQLPLPIDVCAVLTEEVLQRGRGLKGRAYIPGFAVNANVAGGMLSGPAQTALNTFGTAVFNAISTNSMTPCVAQVARQAYTGAGGAQHPPRAAGHVNVSQYICQDLLWDTQRRRGAA